MIRTKGRPMLEPYPFEQAAVFRGEIPIPSIPPVFPLLLVDLTSRLADSLPLR